METISKVYIGVDIAKCTMDIYFYPQGKKVVIKNSEAEIKKFIRSLSQHNVELIFCEATGGHERLLAKLIEKSPYKLWIVDPRRIKGFIVASGCKAKTDKIDAQKIAEFAAKNTQDYEHFVKTENEELLQALANRRQDLTKFLASEKTRFKSPVHILSASNIKKMMGWVEKEIKALEVQISTLVKKDLALGAKSSLLESIPGIGSASAAILMSHLPELGTLSSKEIAALVGVSPYNRDSGNFKGKRFIRGGRMVPRNTLYMCALTTIKYNLILKDFYDRLRARQKPFKVAIVAVMRKMIIMANAILKKGEPCRV